MTDASEAKARIFVATPMYDGRVHHAYMMGVVQMAMEFPGELILAKSASSYGPHNHDRLTQLFMESNATHALWVASDIAWAPADARQLFEADRDFVTGLYGKRQGEGRPLAPERRDGKLLELEYTGAGFMLLKRRCIQRLCAAHPELSYEGIGGTAFALWSPRFSGQIYSGERTFCQYWRALGGQIWAHTSVVVQRHGETVYVPDGYAAPPGPEAQKP